MDEPVAVPTRRFAVVIAGGGTGGHLYPGVAVARALLADRPDAVISFAGTARGLEARVVPREGFELDLVRSAGLKGKSFASRLRGLLLLGPSMWDAWRLLSRRKPSVVIGVGGYSSGPVVLLAVLRGIPTMVLEQNAVPGLTNRLLAPVVRAAAVSYDTTLRFFGSRGFLAGNPVRPEFFGARPVVVGAEAPHVLILGGSQGAHAINVAVVAAAAEIQRRQPRVAIVHQSGTRDLDDVRRGYAEARVAARVEPFLDPVAGEVLAADLVIARAGATTLAELAAAGRPAVLIPLATATDDHQRKNARVIAEAGAAAVVDERDLSGARLADVVDGLLADPARLDSMGAAMRTFARPDAASRIVRRVRELVG